MNISMKFLPLLLTAGQPIIKNINIPACRNCKYYKIGFWDTTGYISKCGKFGEKDINTGQISFDFANDCRRDEEKCGKQGKYFEKDPNLNFRLLKYTLVNNIPSILVGFSFVGLIIGAALK